MVSPSATRTVVAVAIGSRCSPPSVCGSWAIAMYSAEMASCSAGEKSSHADGAVDVAISSAYFMVSSVRLLAGGTSGAAAVRQLCQRADNHDHDDRDDEQRDHPQQHPEHRR